MHICKFLKSLIYIKITCFYNLKTEKCEDFYPQNKTKVIVFLLSFFITPKQEKKNIKCVLFLIIHKF